jgi:hypothetical protein
MTAESFPNTNVAASLASIGYGAAFSVGPGLVPASAIYVQIAEITDVDWSGLTVGAEEVTSLGSPNMGKEYIPSLIDGGKFTIEGNLIGDTSQQSILTSVLARTVQSFQVQTLVNAKTKTYTVQGIGFFTKFAPTGKVEAGKPVKFSAEVQISGLPTVTLV